MKKKGIRRVIPWAALALLALTLGSLPTLARNAADISEAAVLSAVTESGTIENTLAGGGTLTAEKATEVTVPSTIEITEFLVKNGDRVEEGQPLARVNRVTLLGAIAEVQQNLEEIAFEMLTNANRYSVAKLSSQVNGRVKALYAGVGDDVRQATLEHGAAAVVSVDGLMVAEVLTDRPVQAGESLTVRLSDGTEVPGRAETFLEGRLRVTLSDDGPLLDDTVSVLTATGEKLGEGTLAAHSPWDLLATDGVVNHVYVSENQKIWAGNDIYAVEKLTGNTEYQALASKHRQYEELMDELFELYADDTVRAPVAGFVSGIDEKIIKNTAAEGKEHRLQLLSAETQEPQETARTTPVVILVTGVNGNQVTGIDYTEEIDLTNLDALLALMSTGNRTLIIDNNDLQIGDIIAVVIDEENKAIGYEKINHIDIAGLLAQAEKLQEALQMPQIPSFDISGLLGGFSFNIPSVPTEPEEETLYDLKGKTILSITPDDSMTVSISVDELDVLQYELGMNADVTVDALPDREFTAHVTEIGAMGENAGGNSKYTVKLRLDRAPDMLDGMNASVTVHRGSREALLLPAAAIHDRGSRSYVYTALDGKSGKPTAELQVATGISDGEKVEITEGLAEGQTVYYEYYLPREESSGGRN